MSQIDTPAFYWDSTPDESDVALADEHNQAMMDELGTSSQELLVDYDNVANDKRYKRVRAYIGQRHDQLLEHENGGDPLPASIQSFAVLHELYGSADSHYIKRMLEWGMMQEAHYVAERGIGGGLAADLDQAKSDPEALRRYFANEDEGE